jgi:hypothetical protein
MPSEVVAKFPVRGDHVVLCRVEYHKGRGYFFCADVLSLGMVMAGRMELAKEAKRFSQKTFDDLVWTFRNACAAEDPRVMRHVAEAAERVPKEVSNGS